MLSIDYELSVPGFSSSEIGYGTFVRAKPANLQINVTNDGQRSLYKLNVKPITNWLLFVCCFILSFCHYGIISSVSYIDSECN